MLHGIARLAVTSPRRVILGAVLVMIGAAIFGVPVIKSLSAGGGLDPGAESSRASALLSEKFDQGSTGMLITVTSDGGALGPQASAVGTELVRRLQNSEHVRQVSSTWTVPAATAASLVSKDGRTGLISARIVGGESDAQLTAKRLVDEFVHDRDGVTVRAGGEAVINWQVNAQTQRDLFFMEALALPLSFVVLVWVFGGLVAGALPVAVGFSAILGALASLRMIALFTNVSIFSLNLTVAMGMALAVDYTLLILSRFRDELAEGHPRDRALTRTMLTAGRTVLFSAMTVALSMATLVLFPQFFLKSFAYAGVAVVAFAAAAAIVVAPAAIMLLGGRLDLLNIRRWVGRLRSGSDQRNPKRWSWYRWTKAVMRRSVPIGVAVTALLLLLGSPFLNVRWGFADDRILPSSASARQVGDELRNNFPDRGIPNITAVLPDAPNLSPVELDAYAAELSRVPQVLWVSAPGGTFVDGGRQQGWRPASAPGAIKDGSAFVTIGTEAPLYTAAADAQLDRLHAVPTPGGVPVQLTGVAQSNRDSVHAISSRLPVVLTLIAVITMGLVFLLTGSAVLPVKAVLMNTLSLTAAFGALVWVFQEGHLGGLGTAATGTLGVQLPVLLFCIAFGLSMDYEVFLISRIREYWAAADGGPDANDESVALGVAHTARVITAAALIMAISFSALMAAQVSFMRLFGFGLTVAVLADATLVRMLLVPAFMHVLGRVNWWAPKPLVRLHDRFGFTENLPGIATAKTEPMVLPRTLPLEMQRTVPFKLDKTLPRGAAAAQQAELDQKADQKRKRLIATGIVVIVAVVVGATGYLAWPEDQKTTPKATAPSATSGASATSTTTKPPAPTTSSPPLVAPNRLGSILLTPAEANAVMGATGMQDQGSFSGADTNLFTTSIPDCLGAAHIVQPAVWSGSGYTAIRVDVLHQPGNRYTHNIEQAVATFPSPEQALAFVKASAPKWKACAGKSVVDTLQGVTTRWAFGDFVGDVPTIAMMYSRQNARGWTCQRALSAVWNLVIDVKACGYTINDQGLQAVDKIATKATK